MERDESSYNKNVPCTVHKNSIVHSAVHSTGMAYIPVKQLETPIYTCTVCVWPIWVTGS